MAYVNPHLFDTQQAGDLLAQGGGWEGKFLTSGSSWTKVQNTGIWPASVWARRHVLHPLPGTDEASRERNLATYNSMGQGIDVGDDNGPGDTIWQYEEFYLPSSSFPAQFAGGSWNFFAVNWHHGQGVNGSVGQVPFHIGVTTALGGHKLFCQVRGGLQISSSNAGSTAPNEEDFILDDAVQYNHIYRVMVRMTLAPNGTPPARNRFLGSNLAGSYIVDLDTGDSHGIIEVWVDDELIVSKRRPTSYYDLTMYMRSDMFGRNPDMTPSGDAISYATKRTQGRTRSELFATIEPTTADTFQDGQDSVSGGGGTPPPPPPASADTLPSIPANKVRYGVVTTGQPPTGRVAMGADRVRASGPISVTEKTSIEKLFFHVEAAGSGTQVFKIVVWDDDGASGEPGTRKILSQEISKAGPLDPEWIEVTLGAAVELEAGNYWVGVHSGPAGNVLTYAYESVAGSYRSATDTYSDGTPTSFPANTPDRYKMAVVMEGTFVGTGDPGSEDTTKPTVQAAAAQVPDDIILHVDEELDDDLTPDAAAFTVVLQPPGDVSIEVAEDSTGDDGYGQRTSATYASIGSGTFSDLSSSDADEIYVSRSESAGTFDVSNGFLRFDTSSLPDDAIVTAARLDVWTSFLQSDDDLNLIGEFYDFGGTPSASADWKDMDADADTCLNVPIEDITFSGSASVPAQIPITDHLDQINTGGVTGLRLGISKLASNAEPTGTNAVSFGSFDAGSPKHPTLFLLYTTSQPVEQEVQGVTITPSTVSIDLNAVITSGQSIKVSYDKTQAVNPIKDLAGNEMDSFSDMDVSNENAPTVYDRTTAVARVVDPTKRLVDPSNRIVGRNREVWT